MGKEINVLGKTRFDSNDYKKRTIKIWNEIAPRYHKRWAGASTGPFQSTAKLVCEAKIKKNDCILDMACGTGAVTSEISSKISKDGSVVGFDISSKALQIAKKSNCKKNVDYILADAETIHLKKQFNVVTCQYALFFFADAQKVLNNTRRFLKKNGTLVISVHGRNVPFYDCILNAVTQFIPDYIVAESPRLDRFNTQKALKDKVKKSGFVKVKTHSFVFRYSPGKFENYWRNYLRYIAKPLKEKINKLSSSQKKNFREIVKKNTLPYTKNNGIIVFPWQVLVLSAKK